jgi:hypothetical protein
LSARRCHVCPNITVTFKSTDDSYPINLGNFFLQLDNIELAQAIVEDCVGLALALAKAAGYLRRDPRCWKSLSDSIRKEITTDNKPMFIISQDTGLYSVFQTSLEWLGRDMAPPQNCLFSRAELYTSLCTTDPSSPGLPLCILSLMWGMCAECAQSVCSFA